MLAKLIKDAYKLHKSGHLVGIMYNSGKSVGFSEINDEDLEKLLELKWDMLYLKSIPTDTEIQIYEDELKNYVIKKSEETLFVLTNRGETRLMY